jgi:2-oxo-4-hydroxy-4-carboxy-5-ureidoimidazoline decarboxylase
MSGVEQLNRLDDDQARAALAQCCGSRRWVDGMLARRPFATRDALLESADQVWWSLDAADWLEAFRSHPRIGERKAEAGQTDRERRWSSGEQSGMSSAAEAVRDAIAEGNRRYEARFGYIYIVCASGRTADEMLRLLTRRLDNPAEAELRVAAGEQARITRLRLEKLLDSDSPPHPTTP